MSDDRTQLLLSLGRLYAYLDDMSASSNILDNVHDLIKASTRYDPANLVLDWQPVNNRYEGALLGERNSIVYIAHLLTTEPAWVDVEILTSKQEQATEALDLKIIGRKDRPETEQCKTGHLGKSRDLYVHKEWLSGSPDNIIAVCIEQEVIYGGPLSAWKATYKEGSFTLREREKWMYASYFKECGGWVTDICEEVKRIM